MVVGSRVPVTVTIGLLLARINWHQVLHALRRFRFPLIPQALCGTEEDDGRDEAPTHADPADDVGPAVEESHVVAENLRPRVEIGLLNLESLVVFLAVP